MAPIPPRGQGEHANNLARFIPFRYLIDPGVISTRDGDLVATWRLSGVDCSTASKEQIHQVHVSLCQMIQGIARDRVGVWVHRVRRKLADASAPLDSHSSGAIRIINEAHKAQIQEHGLYATELYLSAVFRSDSHRTSSQPGASIFSDLSRFRTIAELITSALKQFNPTRLEVIEQNGVRYSEQLRLFGYLLNAVDEPVPVPKKDIAPALATSALSLERGHLTIRSANRTRHVFLIDLKEYPSSTSPGMLDSVLDGAYEAIETQSFLPLTRIGAERFLKKQRNQLISSGDSSSSQIEEIATALDGVASQDFVLGEYHYSLAACAESKDAGLAIVASLRSKLNDIGFQSALIDIVADLAWFAQLPGNLSYRARSARLSSRNFCALSPFHCVISGKKHGNPWGEAIALLAGVNRSPVYFNFHATPLGTDCRGEFAPGNTLVIGQTGSGKTVLELFLLSQAIRFSPRVMLFDKDRSSEIAMRAFGASYTVFQPGQPTGLNPLQWPVSQKNLAFMTRWVFSLVSSATSPAAEDREALHQALATLITFPKSQRRLSLLLENIPLSAAGLRSELQPWCRGGALGWAFDQEPFADPLSNELSGFDLTAFFPTPELLVPVMLALLEQLEQWLDGSPFIYVIAECWRALDEPALGSFMRDKQKTIRKQNGFGIFDTQSPRDLLDSGYAATLIEQTATMILLPNPLGSESDYCDGLKCTREEFRMLGKLAVGSHQFLIKQGSSCSIASLDFSGSPEVLTMLSSNSHSVAQLDRIRGSHGDAFDTWWPLLTDQLRSPSPRNDEAT